jgi:hypothetical protein
MADFDDEFREIPGTNQGYYTQAGGTGIEPLNHAHTAGSTLLMLHELTGKEKYLDKTRRLCRFFLSTVRRNLNGSWEWGYWPTVENRTGQFGEHVWKAEVTIKLPILAHERETVFTRQDMRAMARTFLVRRPDNQFNQLIDDDVVRLMEDGPLVSWDQFQNMVGWVALGRYNAEVADAVVDAVAQRPDLFPNGWFHDLKTAESYIQWLGMPR